MSEQVNSDGALNGCDREKAARGSSTEGGSDPETVCKCSLLGPLGKISPEALMQIHLNTHFSYLSHSFCRDALLSDTLAHSCTVVTAKKKPSTVFITYKPGTKTNSDSLIRADFQFLCERDCFSLRIRT